MEYLLTAEEMAQADRMTSEEIGIPSLVLMERAALGVAGAVRADYPAPHPGLRCAVVAGKGNNGADAAAAGRMLTDAGYEVRFYLVTRDGVMPEADPARRETAMDTQLRIIRSYGLSPQPFRQSDFAAYRPDIILDGLFGTGLSCAVGEPYASAIRLINQMRGENGSRVYSVDIPSGVDGTSGEIMGCAVRADVTVTFAFYKRGHFLYPGCGQCGQLILHEIGITQRSLSRRPGMFTYRTETAQDLLPARDGGGNKGTFGKVLVIAGSKGVSGACTMSAGAVLRTGAGMVKVFTHEDNRIILQETVPEAMCSTWSEEDHLSGAVLPALRRDLSWADVAAIGPGLGRGAAARDLLAAVLDDAAERGAASGAGSSGPSAAAGEASRASDAGKRFGLVIDADAIRLIAQYDLYEKLGAAGRAARVILTPHMAECAALFHMDVSDLKKQRFTLAKEFADRYSCTLCLKDARTLIASPQSDTLYLNTSGNDGLSTAGSGDILTGVAAGCLAQGMDAFCAACAASYLHGCAADRLTEDMSRRCLMATDLLKVL